MVAQSVSRRTVAGLRCCDRGHHHDAALGHQVKTFHFMRVLDSVGVLVSVR